MHTPRCRKQKVNAIKSVLTVQQAEINKDKRAKGIK